MGAGMEWGQLKVTHILNKMVEWDLVIPVYSYIVWYKDIGLPSDLGGQLTF